MTIPETINTDSYNEQTGDSDYSTSVGSTTLSEDIELADASQDETMNWETKEGFYYSPNLESQLQSLSTANVMNFGTIDFFQFGQACKNSGSAYVKNDTSYYFSPNSEGIATEGSTAIIYSDLPTVSGNKYYKCNWSLYLLSSEQKYNTHKMFSSKEWRNSNYWDTNKTRTYSQVFDSITATFGDGSTADLLNTSFGSIYSRTASFSGPTITFKYKSGMESYKYPALYNGSYGSTGTRLYGFSCSCSLVQKNIDTEMNVYIFKNTMNQSYTDSSGNTETMSDYEKYITIAPSSATDVYIPEGVNPVATVKVDENGDLYDLNIL